MRKGIFGAVVIVLACSCWVVAQNASSNQAASPYGAQVPSAPKSPAMPVGNVPSADPVVIPTTELDVPGIPPVPPAPMRAPVFKVDPPVTVPPTMPGPRIDPIAPLDIKLPDAPVAPPAYKFPDPPIEAPVNKFEQSKPFTLPVPSYEPPVGVAPAPIIAPEYPTSVVPPIDDKQPIRSVTTPAVPGLPALPPVPGVPSLPPGMPNYTGPVMQGNGVPMINTQMPPPNPNIGGPTQLQPPPQGPTSPDPRWTVDDPGPWQNRQPLRDKLDPSRERILGPRIWGSAEYLAWFVQNSASPPLVQTVLGVAPGSTSFNGGQVVNLFPNQSINYDILSGVRGTLGFWFNQTQTVGMEIGYMWFGTASDHDAFNSQSNAILGRPFFNASTGRADLFQVSDLSGTHGVIRASSSIQIQGGEANFLFNSMSVGPDLNLIAGFRYLQISEQLKIDDYSQNNASNIAAYSYDKFGTHNNFFGGQVGARWSFESRRFFGSITGKVAFGAMNESINIGGGTSVMTPSATTTATGGVLAQATNIGSHSRTATAFIPEANATIGFRFTPWATGFVGYNFMYISEMVRPVGQIDPSVNPVNFPFGAGSATASHPSFHFRGESMWMQGVNFGLRFQY